MPAVTDRVQRRLWLAAGWLSIAYVVLTFVPIGASASNTLGSTSSSYAKALVTSSLTRTFAGGYVWLIAALVFLMGALLTARLLRGEGVLGDWLSAVMSGAAVAYVAVQMAVGAASVAAVYDGHHGAPLAAVTVVDDINNVGFGLSGALVGVFMLVASGAIQYTKLLARWFAAVGYVVGVIEIAAVPAMKAGAPQVILWFVWIVVFGVLALRRARTMAAPAQAIAVGATA